MKTNHTLLAVALIALVVTASACAGTNVEQVAEGAGFWRGIVHGLIAPITFVISLFRDDVSMYEVQNDGGWYNFGFLLGLSCWHGGGGAAIANGRRRRRRTDQE